MITIVIITIIKDFTAWLEGYGTKSCYLEKNVFVLNSVFQKENKRASFGSYPFVLGQATWLPRTSILAYVKWG